MSKQESFTELCHSPARIIVFSFLLLIFIGTALLALPISRVAYIPLMDLFFTATSATCVTGLLTIPLNSFTLFGKCIIMLLIQCGALGIASMSLIILSLFIDLKISTRYMAGRMLELDTWSDLKTIIRFTFISTLLFELLGALCFFIIFYHDYALDHALFYALFHSVSSFCSAGVSFLHFFTEQNLGIYSNNYAFLMITSLLTFLGGIGFISLHEIMEYIRTYYYTKKQLRFSLHTKIILFTAVILIGVSTLLFFMLEYNNTLKLFSLPTALVNSLFHAISFKSCGFVLAHLEDFKSATLFIIMIIGFIGSAPGSTGSGVKITTCALIAALVRATIDGKTSTEFFKRTIPIDQVNKAVTIVTLGILWILLITFILLLTEPHWSFLEIFFEVVSTFSNVGFSLKGPQNLSLLGKLLICATMFIGRIGSLTCILSFKIAKRKKYSFAYPEERIMLG